MARYVIDAATLLHLVSDGAPAVGDHQLVAPQAIRSQTLQLLLDEVRAGALTEKEALTAHELMTELKMRLLGDRVSRRTAWRLALEHHLTIGDAVYLAVTMLQADALVTVDTRLADLASGVVPLALVADLGSA